MASRIVIVGGGLAGLCCALHLQRAGRDCLVLEAADAPGGRMRTDVVEGFQLDRGFQVFLPAYPEAKAMLDYAALQLKPLASGAAIWHGGQFHVLGDPLRQPGLAWATLTTGVVSFADKRAVWRLRRDVLSPSLDELMQRPQTTTAEYLRQRGFSDLMIQRFFRPWLSGIFLEPNLDTSSRMFQFVYRMFALGGAAVPSAGMEAIPRQLAAGLQPDTLRLNTPVRRVHRGTPSQPARVELADGQTLDAAQVVLATEAPAAAKLLGDRAAAPGCRARCLYFAAPQPPRHGALLMLNGQGPGDGPVNHAAVMSEAASSYAPPGQALVCTAIDPACELPAAALETDVRRQMAGWFGRAAVEPWRLLRSYDIAYALPRQPVEALDPPHRPVRLGQGLFRCSDELDTASIQGAMVCGRRTAHALLSEN